MAGGDLTVCPTDGKRIAKASLYRHQIVHSAAVGENDCEICGKQFKTGYDLMKHTRYGPHSGNSFTCEECSKSSTRKATLTKQIQRQKIHLMHPTALECYENRTS